MNQLKNELEKNFITKHTLTIIIFIATVLLFLYLIFPIAFNYNNDQQTFSKSDWKEELELKKKTLNNKIEKIEKYKIITPREAADLQSLKDEKKRLNIYKEHNINPPASNNLYDNSLTITGLNKLSVLSMILISSIIISKEFTDGTIQTMLLQPIAKTKIMLGKIYVLLFMNFFILFIMYGFAVLFSYLISSSKYFGGLIVENLNNHNYEVINYTSRFITLFIGDYIYSIIFSLITMWVCLLFRGNLLAIGIPIIMLFSWTSISGFLSTFVKSDYLIPNHWNLNDHWGVVTQSTLEMSGYGTSLLVSLLTIIVLILLSLVTFNKIKHE